MDELVTRNLVILLTDIKGFTDRTSRQSRVEIQQLLEQHKKILLPILKSKGGTLVKTMGDAFLMTYESPTNAVLAGIRVQAALRSYNLGKPPEQRIEVRVAINQGEVNLADDDVFGEPVNITARIEAVADAGDIYFTEAVYLSMNKNEVPSSEVGLLQLKGVPEKIRVYKVRREEPVEPAAMTAGRPAASPASAPPAAPPAAAPVAAPAAAALPAKAPFPRLPTIPPFPMSLIEGVAWKPVALVVAGLVVVLLVRSHRSAPPVMPAHALALWVTGRNTYTQTVSVTEGKQGNFVGPMAAADGRDQRQTAFSVLLSPVDGRPGAFDVKYQLDFAADPADASTSLKASGEVALSLGGGVTAVECGPWKVDIALGAGIGQPDRGATAGAAGIDNYRLTADLTKGQDKVRCRELLKLGATGSVAEGAGGKAPSLIFNVLPGPSANGDAVDVQYQLEYRPAASPDLVQIQNQQTLALDRASHAQASGYQFDLLAEGASMNASAQGASN
jgi:class 3 adenylate cyclase